LSLLVGGDGESHQGLLEGGADDMTNKQPIHTERKVNVLMNQILDRKNIDRALERVEKNDGSHGVDEMSVNELRPYLNKYWSTIREELRNGTYQPKPARRVEITKPDGGIRLLGIPTVVDRLIQQAIAQVLTREFDPTFSPFSYGFRPGKQAHHAVKSARRWIETGHTWVIDIDLEKFFDKVNHDRLMSKLAQRIDDKVLLKLIRRYLQSGIAIGGIIHITEEGTPQGGPLSPLLSNIVLDELDKELEKRNLNFARYADDCNIYVKSKKAAKRIMESITHFIEVKLKLKVNLKKSAYDRPWNRKFLGFSFTRNGKNPKIRVSNQSRVRIKKKIKRMTSRKNPMSIEDRVKKLNQYLHGWFGYYQLAEIVSLLKQLDQWIRRRLRMCVWKQWKLPRTRIKNLIKLGVSKQKAYEWGNTRKGYWRISSSPILHIALGKAYWQELGLVSLENKYNSKLCLT